ncbi:MAG: DUF5591 domain-containing protein [Thermodesulfovibrionia bacterium]|nr:DUF5591 domain-containing protein [Thermodesulfovibrionia bacterium]
MHDSILILRSGRCSWGKCFFCGYGKIPGHEPTKDNVIRDFREFFDCLPGTKKDSSRAFDRVKVFGSGSFLDEKQVPSGARRYFIGRCKKEGIKKVTIESRPEFITDDILMEFEGLDLTVSLGLEIACDEILDRIHKGFHKKDFEIAAGTIHKYGKVRTYLIVNLPFVSDIQKSIEESLDCSVKYALKFSDSIVLINLLPHGNTKVFRMWLGGEWNFLSKEEFYRITEKWKDHPKIELDSETFRFVPKFQKSLRQRLSGVGEEFLTHPHFEVWQDYLVRWYSPGERTRRTDGKNDRDILLFLPCAYKKPYSESRTHRQIIESIGRLPFSISGRIHHVMISNAGIVPREFEDMYPFNSYDWDEKLETVEIKDRYTQVTAERIRRYMDAHRDSYNRILCFLKYDSESYKAL